MATVIEKKVKFIGTWKENVLADNIIKMMANRVHQDKGEKVKLRVSREGLSLTKKFLLVGKTMTDYIKLANIYFITINQYHPQCLLVIARCTVAKYQIMAFKCENGLDAGMLVNFFKETKRSTDQNANVNYELKHSDGLNWTLREKKEGATDKRQLSTIVNIQHKEASQRNGDIRKETNGYSHNEPHVITAYIQQDVEPPREIEHTTVMTRETHHFHDDRQNVAIQAEGERASEKHPDNVSESSEGSLRNELDSLSHELRDIKFMLEKSHGIGAEVYHHKTSPKITRGKEMEPIETVVIHGDERDQQTVTTVVRNGHSSTAMEGEVRIQVPDYRSLGTQTYVHKSHQAPKTDDVPTKNYTEWKGETLRANPANSKIWREEVHLRQNISPRSSRPRSHYYSTSSYGSVNESLSGSLRRPNGYVLVEHPRYVSRVHSGTGKRMSTNVHKPIERVYSRPHSVHGSVYKPLVAEKAQLYYTNDNDYHQNNFINSIERNPRDTVVIKY